jgi:RNA polymerase sigma-70 factor (ECF subfamily)
VRERNLDLSFDAVIDQNYARVYNLVLRLVGDRDAAADLTQDVFVRAYQAWGQFRGDSQVYTWLYRIAVNLSRNYLERRARERRLRVPDSNEEEGGPSQEMADERHLPEDLAESDELGRLLVLELSRMRPEHREIVVLRDVEGLPYEEIARILGCSVQAVKSKLFRARSVLRQRLSSYLGWNGS